MCFVGASLLTDLITFARISGRSSYVFVFFTFAGVIIAAPVAGAVEWQAGSYTFSDEMGGFTIDGISGKGTLKDPVVLRETFTSSSPVTLVIRADYYATGKFYMDGILYLRIVTRNGSGQGWVEFEFELQELLHQASVFGDGLSFDQRNTERDFVSSDSFARFSRDFEPFDKLLFTQGKIDPKETGTFSFLITDFTPRGQFYLVQDPRIPLM
jgi:hypothetical protein